MPTQKQKVTLAQMRVGIMALAAMIIAAVLIFLLTGKYNLFQRNVEIKTYMEDSSGMAESAPVRLNGILIGSVDRLKLSGSKDPRRVVEIDMLVQEKFLKDIPDDSVAGISASNLLGDKFVNITKGKHATHVQPEGELPSLPSQDIPELIAQSSNLLTSFQGIVKRVDTMLGDIDAGRGNVGKFLKDEELYSRLNSTVAEAEKVISDVRTGKGTISRLLYDDALYQDLRLPIQRINELLTELQQGRGSAGKLLKDPALYDDLQKTSTQIRQLLDELNAGKGTAGKLLKDDQLYSKINQLLVKFDATVDKINSGQGTIGQLMVNPQLYETLNGATGELHQLFKDIRTNPKKFLRIKLALF